MGVPQAIIVKADNTAGLAAVNAFIDESRSNGFLGLSIAKAANGTEVEPARMQNLPSLVESCFLPSANKRRLLNTTVLIADDTFQLSCQTALPVVCRRLFGIGPPTPV